MKAISVSLEVNQNSNYATFDYDDLGTTEEEWQELSESEKTELLQEAVDNMPDQPYWIVAKITED